MIENIVGSIRQGITSGINCGLTSHFVGTNAKVSAIYCFSFQLFTEISNSAQKFEDSLWNLGGMIFQTVGGIASVSYVPSRIQATYDPNFTARNLANLWMGKGMLESAESMIFSYFFPTESESRLPEMFFRNITAFNTSNICLPSEAP